MLAILQVPGKYTRFTAATCTRKTDVFYPADTAGNRKTDVLYWRYMYPENRRPLLTLQAENRRHVRTFSDEIMVILKSSCNFSGEIIK